MHIARSMIHRGGQQPGQNRPCGIRSGDVLPLAEVKKGRKFISVLKSSVVLARKGAGLTSMPDGSQSAPAPEAPNAIESSAAGVLPETTGEASSSSTPPAAKDEVFDGKEMDPETLLTTETKDQGGHISADCMNGLHADIGYEGDQDRSTPSASSISGIASKTRGDDDVKLSAAKRMKMTLARTASDESWGGDVSNSPEYHTMRFQDFNVLGLAADLCVQELAGARLHRRVDQAGLLPTPLKVGGFCSGSGVFGMGIESMLQEISDVALVHLRCKHSFVCESKKWKQEWLIENTQIGCCCFNDVCKMDKEGPISCARHGECVVPKVHILAGGFSCTSVSHINNTAAQQKGKLQHCTPDDPSLPATFKTWHGCIKLVKQNKPLVLMFENVEALDDAPVSQEGAIMLGQAQLSNLGECCRQLREEGYAVSHKVLASNDYLVPQMRKRLYIWAVRLDSQLLKNVSPTITEQILQTLLELKFKMLPLEVFLLEDSDSRLGLELERLQRTFKLRHAEHLKNMDKCNWP